MAASPSCTVRCVTSNLKISVRLRQAALSASPSELDRLAAMWSEMVGNEAVTRTTLTYRGARKIEVEGSLEDALRDVDFDAPREINMRVGYYGSEGYFSLVATRGVGATLVHIEGPSQSWIDDARERSSARLHSLRPWWHWMRSTLFSTLVAIVLTLLLLLGGASAGILTPEDQVWPLVTVALASVIGHGACWLLIPGLHLGDRIPLNKIWKRAALAFGGILLGAILSTIFAEGARSLFG